MDKKAFWAITGLTTVIAVIALFTYANNDRSLSGSVIEPPFKAPAIDLTRTDGGEFRLSDQREGVTLIFFGYTNCPDECPLAMANLKLAVDLLEQDSTKATVLMVTTDPDRDSPEALEAFLGKFNAEFVGLTGSRSQLESVWRAYGVTVMDGGETHSNYIYVVDEAGMLVETLLADAAAADIAADIRTLLRRD